MNSRRIAAAIADFVSRDQNGFAEAILVSYPAAVIPHLTLLVQDELDKAGQAKFATFMAQLYEDQE